jgi:hypothetical protein
MQGVPRNAAHSLQASNESGFLISTFPQNFTVVAAEFGWADLYLASLQWSYPPVAGRHHYSVG